MGANQPIQCFDRERELHQLHERLEQMLSGKGGACFVCGEPGTGKSTLVQAFEQLAQSTSERLLIARGRCDEFTGHASSLTPWRDVLNALSGVSLPPGLPEPRTSQQQRVVSALRELGPDLIELLVPGVGLLMRSTKLLGRTTSLGKRVTSFLKQPGQHGKLDADRSKLMSRFTAALEKAAQEAPLLVVVEDLHWADQASLDLLGHMVARMSSKRILLLGTFRPSTIDDDHPLKTIAPASTVVDLDAQQTKFGYRFTKTYVNETTPGLDDPFVDALWRHTGGNALFLSELVDSLVDNGSLAQSASGWRLRAAIDWSELPIRLEDTIQQQLAHVDDNLRDFFNVACVEGETFTVEVVAGLMKVDPLELVRTLNKGNGAHLVEPVGTTILNGRRIAKYRFAHNLYSHYLYQQIEEIERSYLHDAVATQLEALAGSGGATGGTELGGNDAGGTEIVATLAFHFERANNLQKSAFYHEAAAVEARGVGALAQAADHLARALESRDSLTAGQRFGLRRAAAHIARERGSLRSSETLLREILALPNTSPGNLSEIHSDLATVLTDLHDLPASKQHAELANQLAQHSDDPNHLAQALRALAGLQNRSGEFHASLETLLQVYEIDKNSAAGASLTLCDDLYRIGWALKEVGRNDDAEKSLRESLAMQQQLEDPEWALLARTHQAIADLHMNREAYPEARQHVKQAVEYWSKFDQHAEIRDAQNAIANLANREGDFAEGLRYARLAYKNYVNALGANHADVAFPLTCLGESLLGLGQFDEAIASLNDALDIRIQQDVRVGNRAWTQWLLGRALLESERDVVRGREIVNTARLDLRSLGPVTTSEVNEIDAWMTRHNY